MRRGPSIRLLLLVVNAFILLVPLGALLLSKFYETHLVRQTEGRLIGEAVLIGELWRERLLEELGRSTEQVAGYLPQGAMDGELAPLEPLLDLNDGLLPRASEPDCFAESREGPAWRAGARIQAALARAKSQNLSGVRVLDEHGCVVASSGEELGACLDDQQEVRTALKGRYAAVMRERLLDHPLPPLDSISRRGGVRVFVAVPVLLDGRVVGVVRASRTSRDLLEGVWQHRRTLLAGLLACGLVTMAISLFLSRTISAPVEGITAAAEAVSHGEPPDRFVPRGLVPAEVHILREALRRMTVLLTDRASSIAEFAATASHELKTPLTSVRGAAELLRDAWDEMPQAQRERFLDNIEADVERMERLVRRLLQLARIQSSPEAASTIELRPFLETLASRYAGQVRLHLEEGAPSSIVIPPEHLESSVRNLLDNAVRHGRGLPVDLTLREAGGRVRIDVRDRGAGISEGNRAKIFDRFFTTERDRGGTGLGLSIVQAVARTRGGEVGFETGEGGTVFTLIL